MSGAIHPVYRLLGARVKEIRNAVGISQDDLAKRLKITRASVANIEAGRQRVLLHFIPNLARAVGTTERHLMKVIWP